MGPATARCVAGPSRRAGSDAWALLPGEPLAAAATADGLVFASSGAKPLDLRNLRARYWRPALRSAGLAHPHRIYDLRHTYATWSLRAGVGIYQLARRMGTSVEMIDATYGHLAADASEHERALLDAWDGE